MIQREGESECGEDCGKGGDKEEVGATACDCQRGCVTETGTTVDVLPVDGVHLSKSVDDEARRLVGGRSRFVSKNLYVTFANLFLRLTHHLFLTSISFPPFCNRSDGNNSSVDSA